MGERKEDRVAMRLKKGRKGNFCDYSIEQQKESTGEIILHLKRGKGRGGRGGLLWIGRGVARWEDS